MKKMKNNTNNLLSLPSDVFLEMFSFLRHKDVIAKSLVCQVFYQHCSCNQYWETVLLNTRQKVSKFIPELHELQAILKTVETTSPQFAAKKSTSLILKHVNEFRFKFKSKLSKEYLPKWHQFPLTFNCHYIGKKAILEAPMNCKMYDFCNLSAPSIKSKPRHVFLHLLILTNKVYASGMGNVGKTTLINTFLNIVPPFYDAVRNDYEKKAFHSKI